MKASTKKAWEGYYNPLGGHVEKGESVIESAEREIMEEASLEVNNTVLRGILHSTGFFGADVMLFITSSKADSKSVKSNDEGELIWVKIDEIENFKLLEDVKPIVKHVLEMDRDKIFVGISEYDGHDKLISLDININ